MRSHHRPATDDTPESSGRREQQQQSRERFDQELSMHLEHDQFVAETSRPVSRAVLGARTVAALWALRVFVMVVTLMVVYVFIAQLA
jgi:hypothetical protein